MNERVRFRAWVASGTLTPVLGSLALAGLFRAPDQLSTALVILGTGCETAGLMFAAIQLNGVAKHWGFEGFWRRLGRPKAIVGTATGTIGIGLRAQGTGTAIIDPTGRTIEQRLEYLEHSLTLLQENLGHIAAEQRRQIDEVKAAVGEVREAGRLAVRTLEERLKTLAVADFGAAFGFLILTTLGMIIANLAEQLSHALRWLL